MNARRAPLADALIGVLAIVTVVGVLFALRSAGAPSIAGRSTPTSAGSSDDPTTRSKVVSLWVGDSFTTGASAPSPAQGEACLTASRLHWVCHLDAEAHAGFVMGEGEGSSQSLPQRLPGDRDLRPQVVVIDAGRNDVQVPLGRRERATTTYVAAVRRAFRSARIVLIAPYQMSSLPSYARSYRLFEKQLAQRDHLDFVDPIAEGWIPVDATRGLTTPDRKHPNAAGHRYLSQHLFEDFRRLGLDQVTPGS